MNTRRTRVLAVAMALALPGLAYAAAAASPVADAARQQDKAAIRAMLKAKGDVNAPQPDGATALHWATHWDDAETIELLLSAGAKVNVKNDYGVTPISLASENANLVVVQRLIKAGADVNAPTSTGETPLMTAVRAGSVPVVKALIAAGANVNVKGGGRDQTALHWAVSQQQREIMRLLIDAKADLNARTELRPEFVSFSRGNPQGGRLTGIADHTLESDGSRPGLRWINKGGLTPILFAARDGDLESVKMLVAAGANINATTGLGETGLMLAAHNDHTPVGLYLLDKGADPNIVEAGHTALHFAVARKNTELVKSLIAHKADVNARLTKGQPDPDGNLRYNQLPEYLLGATPYLLATALNETETMKILAAAGANVTTPMEDGTTPTMASMGVFPGVFTFIPFVKIGEKGAQGDNTAYFQRKRLFSEEKVLETMKLAVELSGGEDINAARGALVTYHVGNSRNLVGRGVGDTALHIAAADKYPTVIEFLISKGAKTDIKNRRGLTPLAIAKSPGRQFITGGDNGEKIGDEKIATLLTSLGAGEKGAVVQRREGSMRARLLTLSWCVTVLLVLPVQANEKPTPEYQKAMKDLGMVNNRLRNNLKDIDFAAIEKDAAAMKEIFATVLTYWQEKKTDDAIKLSQDGIKAATELEMAAKAQNHPAVVTAQAAIAGASSSGEIGAIGVCAPCHTAHRVRLPDGTYEIK